MCANENCLTCDPENSDLCLSCGDDLYLLKADCVEDCEVKLPKYLFKCKIGWFIQI
jgi:hypothetical protein